jgi:hypothetical protein
VWRPTLPQTIGFNADHQLMSESSLVTLYWNWGPGQAPWDVLREPQFFYRGPASRLVCSSSRDFLLGAAHVMV